MNLADTIRSVTVRTTLGSRRFDRPFAAGEPSTGPSTLDWLLRELRLTVELDTALGPIGYSPHGPPEANYAPLVLGAPLLVLGGTAVGLVGLGMWLERRRGRRRR